VCEQLAQGRYLTVPWLGVDPGTFWTLVWPVTVTPPSTKVQSAKNTVRYGEKNNIRGTNLGRILITKFVSVKCHQLMFQAVFSLTLQYFNTF